MRSLVHAELLKLRTTRMFYGNALLALLGVYPRRRPGHPDRRGPRLDRTAHHPRRRPQRPLLGLLGHPPAPRHRHPAHDQRGRHNTATATFLITPDRTKVVAAKLAAATVVGLALAAAASALTLIIALPWLAAKNVDVHLLSSDVGLALLGSVAANTLYAIIGVGLGCLIRIQTAAITASFVWMMVIEGVLTDLRPDVGRWLPGGAANALTSTPTAHDGMLPMWAGALLLAAYALVLATAGTRLTLHHDIT